MILMCSVRSRFQEDSNLEPSVARQHQSLMFITGRTVTTGQGATSKLAHKDVGLKRRREHAHRVCTTIVRECD